MEIKGYTLHCDYYLADEVITNTTWEQACNLKETIVLPNGKTVIAHTLSKEELETIPAKERKADNRWYWTNTTYIGGYAWGVYCNGDFGGGDISYCGNDVGGARLGFHKNEIKQNLNIE